MCGIVGFVGSGSAGDLARMSNAVIHRGPDDDGIWTGSVGGRAIHLGFRRLAILDLESGAQPMASSDGAIVVVFNGEIYNHRSLRRELEGLGHRFRTDHADTEVLIHGYRQWGTGLIERLRGMFAFALVDVVGGRMILARDPFAKKPLFYAQTQDGLIFASELRAVLCHPKASGRVDRQNLIRYFAWDYVPAPRSLYAGISKLRGGHFAVFDIASLKLEITRYWRYRIDPSTRPPGNIDDWTVELRRLLYEAVEKRLQSDVPLGFFLSGGVDSTGVVALARKIVGNRPIKTFTIGFNEPTFDESGAARDVAAHYGTDHYEQVLDIRKATEIVPDLLRRVHEPVVDDALVPTYLLSKMARSQVTVALAGDGGDELFAGYDTFSVLGLARLYNGIVPSWLHRIAKRIAARLPISQRRLGFDFKLRRALEGLTYRPALWHPLWIGAVGVDELGGLVGESQDEELLFQEAAGLWDEGKSSNFVDRSLEFYANYYLQDDLMPKVDTASMLCSLEVRCPYLDRDLADFVTTLPAEVKIRGRERKWLLKRALDDLVPEKVLRRPKQGFSVPLINWLQTLPGPDFGLAEELGLDVGWFRRSVAEHVDGKADHRGLLWAWHCLEGSVKGNAEAVAAARTNKLGIAS